LAVFKDQQQLYTLTLFLLSFQLFTGSTMSSPKVPTYLLPLTKEEKHLLHRYETLKKLERIAAQSKAAAAIARLMEADQTEPNNSANDKAVEQVSSQNEFRQKYQTDKTTKKLKNDKDASFIDENDADMLHSQDENLSSFRRNEEKIAILRQEKDIAAQRIQEQDAHIKREEQLRQQLLEEHQVAETGNLGPSLKKKKRLDDTKEQSLISNIKFTSTPPHDFSKSLGLVDSSGFQLFPSNGVAPSPESAWDPPDDASLPEENCLEFDLLDFKVSKANVGEGNNTVAIKCMVPADSNRFSINIAAPNHKNYHSVLFHFNPRQYEKGGIVVLNDKKSGIWGHGVNIPLSRMPLMFGEISCTLIIQINDEGFDVFINGKHCARLEHRSPLLDDIDKLIIQFPSTDDYGKRENWRVFKVWWGHKDIMVKEEELSNIPGFQSHNAEHETKLFIRNLPRIYNQAEIDVRRAELERAFRKYGGNEGVSVICPINSTFAFVELDSAHVTDLALKEMCGKYHLNRARRSRHEALMEQIAASATSKSVDMDISGSEWG
jgi:hypothetical protein